MRQTNQKVDDNNRKKKNWTHSMYIKLFSTKIGQWKLKSFKTDDINYK